MAADSNIVGYITKTTAANKMDILGVPFQNIGDATINVQDILPGAGIDVWGGDLLRVWDPITAKYVSAYYFGETYDPLDTNYEGDDLGPGWADGDQFRLDFPIFAGQGFWLTTTGNAVVSFPAPAGI